MSEEQISEEIRESLDRKSMEILRIGNIAVRKAQEENRRLGLPNIYWSPERGMYYELPDGTITSESPFKKDEGEK